MEEEGNNYIHTGISKVTCSIAAVSRQVDMSDIQVTAGWDETLPYGEGYLSARIKPEVILGLKMFVVNLEYTR